MALIIVLGVRMYNIGVIKSDEIERYESGVCIDNVGVHW